MVNPPTTDLVLPTGEPATDAPAAAPASVSAAVTVPAGRGVGLRTIGLFVAVWASSLLGGVVGIYLLTLLATRYPWMQPFLFLGAHGDATTFDFWRALIQPGAFTAVLLFCLALEAAFLGIDHSSARRLLERTSASTRVDLFYVLLRITGGINLLAFILSFGLLFWVVNQIHQRLDLRVLQQVDSFVLQFLAVYLINSFLAYWGHRFMHLPWMWELHKVHHAAEEMNVVTPLRNHPIDHVIMSVMNAFPVALLGADRGVVLLYYAVNMVYQAMVHTEVDLPLARWWDKIWITPAAHRIHHSDRPEHFDTNFGIITFWDRLFGTYHPPTQGERLRYGIDDGEVFNRPGHLREVFANVRRWLRPGPGPAAPIRMPAEEGELRKSA